MKDHDKIQEDTTLDHHHLVPKSPLPEEVVHMKPANSTLF